MVVTLMQLETAALMAKRVQNAARKIAWPKFLSPPVNKTAISLNLKERSRGNINELNQLQQDQPPDVLSGDESVFTLHTPKSYKK